MTTDDDLLRRFAALKSGSHTSRDSNNPNLTIKGPLGLGERKQASASFAHHTETARQQALADQDDLERIADGRPVDPDSTWGSIRGEAKEKRDDEDVVKERYGRLRGDRSGWDGASGSGTDGVDADDDDVEALIASLLSTGRGIAPESKDALPPQQSKRDQQGLAKEAETLLRQTQSLIEPPDRSLEGLDADVRTTEDEDGGDDGETEEQILERALAEARLEGHHRTADGGARQKDEVPNGETYLNTTPSRRSPPRGMVSFETSDFPFPELPAHEPTPDSTESVPDDARMALLLGLSGPSTQPGGSNLPSVPSDRPAQIGSKQAGQGWNLPGWNDGRDEDLDSWCCICNKDATIQCAGCDDDLYCDECWRDGHGPGGEQGHRAKRFVWRKGKKGGVGPVT